jgi:hypothetical protein
VTHQIEPVGSGQDGFAHFPLLVPPPARELAEPDQQKNKMPSTGMKITVRIQAIADEGLRLVEIRTAATNTIRT